MGDKIFLLAAILIIFSVTLATETHAEIYKHVDKNGRTTYSNKTVSGANKLPENSPLSTKKHSKNNYPITSRNTQAKRDQKRRKILETELATEKKLLVNAKQSLINAQKNAKVLKINNNNSSQNLMRTSQEIKKQKLLHERNIAALRKELAN